jgi:hypothetical protein
VRLNGIDFDIFGESGDTLWLRRSDHPTDGSSRLCLKHRPSLDDNAGRFTIMTCFVAVTGRHAARIGTGLKTEKQDSRA